MITKIFIFPKPWYTTAVFDSHGHQIPELQGYYLDVRKNLLCALKNNNPEIICDDPDILKDIADWRGRY